MEPLYTSVPSYVGGFIGATASDFPPGAAAAEAPTQQGLHTAAMGYQQQQQPAAVTRPAAPFQSYYAPADAAGVVASVCALPAETPSAFMPLQQQQQVRSGNSSGTSNSHNTTTYRSGAVFGSAGPVGMSYRGGFVPSTYPIPSSAAAFYPPAAATPVGSAALSPPAVAAASGTLPPVGFGHPSSGSAGARGLTLAEAAAAGSSPAASAASAAVPAPVSVMIPAGAAPGSSSAMSAGGPVEPVAASTAAAAGLPARVALESLSAEERGLLQQTRRLLEEGISNTFECITLLSGVLLSRGASPLIHHLLQAWEDAGQQQLSDEKMLCLLYVMNDALQKCRRRGCPLLLLLALQPLHRFCCKIAKQHQSVLRSCMRVIRILKDAKAFGPTTKRCSTQIADALLAALQGNGGAAALPPTAVIQQVLETSAEESSSEGTVATQQQSLRQPGPPQEENGAEVVDIKNDKKLQQQLLQAPPGGGGGAGGNGGGGAAADAYHVHYKIGGGHGAGMVGGSVFLQHATSSSSVRTLPAAIDTFLLQYPVPGDEALAAHINDKFPGDPQEAALRQQISDVLNAIAAAQTALADKAAARRRVEERLRELHHEKQRLRERAERVRRAAAGGAQAQLLLWQQMQQQLQQGGERVDFSLEGIAAEQERLGNLVRAAHAKLRVLLKTEWNRRVELQAVLLSVGHAIEERLDVILPQHVYCREVKSIIDRAALLQASRQQRKQRQEQAAEQQRQEQAVAEQRQHQQQGQRQAQQRQQQQENQQEDEQQQPHEQQQQEERPLDQCKGDHQQEQQQEQEEQKEEQQLQQARARQQHVSGSAVTREPEGTNEAEEQLPPQADQQPHEQEQGMQLPQHEDGQQEEPTFVENDGDGGEACTVTSQALQREGEQGDVREPREGLQESSLTNVDDCGPLDTEELYAEEQLLQEHVDNDGDEQRELEQNEEQPFEQLEEHDGWLV